MNFVIGVTMAILPVFSDGLGGVEMYGVLLAALSAGILIGALLGSTLGKLRVGVVTIFSFSIGAIFWSLAGWISSPVITPILFWSSVDTNWCSKCAICGSNPNYYPELAIRKS